MHYTRKKKTRRARACVSNDKLDAERKAFQAEWATLSVDRLHVLDETGIHLGMTPTYGRALRGRRVEGTAPVNPGMNITVVGSLGRYGMTSMMMLPGALDGAAFKAYVDACLVPVLRHGDVVLMDHLRVHKVKGIEAAIEKSGAKVKCLPPYSPDLSPIELAWSKIKGLLRQAAARTYEALQKAIAHAVQCITESDIRGWFKHCHYCV